MLNFRSSYRAYPDAKLMRLITKGDERAFSVLYDRYGEKMHRYFYRMLWQEQQKAEDFTQELFMKIINKPHLYDPDRSKSPREMHDGDAHEVSMEDFEKALASLRGELSSSRGRGLAILAQGSTSPTLRSLRAKVAAR